jgi:FAD/FMN-containing dehydrogenase
LFLPVIPGSHQVATIGGMIATNAAGLRAVRYGPMRNWVEAISLVDGLGHLHHLTKATLDDAIGREGVTGFVVGATLRLTSLPVRCTVSLQAFDDEMSLLARRDEWLADPALCSGLSALEYLNRHAAIAVGWSPRPHLLAEFESDDGMINDPTLVADLWRLRDGLYPALARKGRHVIEDPQIEGTGQAACLAWLDVEGIPTFGHLGVNILHPCFDPNDDRVAALYERLPGWGGQISGEHGIGLKKKSWTTTEFQADIQRLKKIYDPQNIINRRKLC